MNLRTLVRAPLAFPSRSRSARSHRGPVLGRAQMQRKIDREVHQSKFARLPGGSEGAVPFVQPNEGLFYGLTPSMRPSPPAPKVRPP